VLDLGIAADRIDAIKSRVKQALDAGADLIVTLGGASVGDHDLVQEALTGLGMELDFWKIAMRPGKPLMFGRLGGTRCVGLPGNPVASLVCSQIFLRPLLAKLGGRPYSPDMRNGILDTAMAANDLRQDFVRAIARETAEGLVVTPYLIQDSSMLRTLADANCAIVRVPFAPAVEAGSACQVMMLR
jgi:molybdopterin molybdotransferase